MVYCGCDGMLLFSILIGCVNVSLDRDQNGWVVGKVHYLEKSWRLFFFKVRPSSPLRYTLQDTTCPVCYFFHQSTLHGLWWRYTKKREKKKDVDVSLPNFSEKKNCIDDVSWRDWGRGRRERKTRGRVCLFSASQHAPLHYQAAGRGKESGICMIDTLFKPRLV